eukprot:gene12754-14061_t
MSASLLSFVAILACGLVASGRQLSSRYLRELPEEGMSTLDMIKYFGYPAEEHKVTTDDGYILSLQRIPKGIKGVPSNGQTVFLQHGLVSSSADYVMNLPHESLGFILADLGYDVWLGNSRGNTYSNKHVNLTVHDAKFWDFSWDEMAKYDIPASLNYALQVTKQSELFYVGHSQGTLIAFAEFGRNPDLAKKIKGFFALAPVTTTGHIKGAIKVLSYFTPEVEALLKILGIHDFAPSDWLIKLLAETVCEGKFIDKVCADIIFLICGFDTANLNETRLPVYVSHTPAGTSTKDVIHFAQMVRSNKFQAYDYGQDGNKKHYNQATAPLYSVSASNVPTAIFTSENDWLADPTDVATLKPQIRNLIFSKHLEKWNHLDFIWGDTAYQVIYPEIIKLMKQLA